MAPFRLEEVAAVAEEEEEKVEEDKEEREEEEDKVDSEVKGFLLSIMFFFVCIAGAEDTSATALARSCSLFCTFDAATAASQLPVFAASSTLSDSLFGMVPKRQRKT